MKELTREVSTTEVYGYQAEDGEYFFGKNAKEHCEEYEKTAKFVISKNYESLNKLNVSQSSLTGYAITLDDYEAHVIEIKNADVLEIVNKYLYMKTHDSSSLIEADRIGETVIIFWSYDKDYVNAISDVDEFVKVVTENINDLKNKLKGGVE